MLEIDCALCKTGAKAKETAENIKITTDIIGYELRSKKYLTT
jgi:hypothetical protein